MRVSAAMISGALVLLGAGAPPAVALAQSTGLGDMVGARAGQAEGELERRGYRNVGGQKGDDRSYTNWWNAERRQCVTIAVMDGRFSSITPTTAPDCRQSPSADRRPSRDQRYDRDARRDRWRDDRRYDRTDAGDPSRQCKIEAAAAFDRRPSEITTAGPIRQRNGTLVQGWYDRSKGTRFFTCRFDEEGRFLNVN